MTTQTLLCEEPQIGRGGVWAYISPSRLGKWLTCPLAFRLQYVEGLRQPTTPSLFLGKVVHAGLEVFYRHRHLGVTLEAADVCRRMLEGWGQTIDAENMTFDSATAEQALQQQAVGLVTAYLGHAPTDEKPLAVEVTTQAPLVDPWTGEDLGIPLLGVIDLIVDGPGGAVIADFKTSARSREALEVLHEMQLTSYAYLFRQLSAQTEVGLEIRSLVKTKVPKIEFHGYPARTDAHFRRLFAVIREYLDALDRGRFNYRPGFHCGMCDFATGHCRDWNG
ncbi:MAG: PD-(D/E)XK nuclease family protein [Planctomycetota bacterium]|nr:PD-(D/E)XK nuclease family protein [Planctomycetota bacterium]